MQSGSPVPIPNTEVKHFSAEDSRNAKIGHCQYFFYLMKSIYFSFFYVIIILWVINMSLNIRERFRERKFSYKYKKKIEKDKELEQTKNKETKENNAKIAIFSPLVIVGYIRKFINHFFEQQETIENEKELYSDNKKTTAINNSLYPKNTKINSNSINRHKIAKIAAQPNLDSQKLEKQKKNYNSGMNNQIPLDNRKKKLVQYKFLEDEISIIIITQVMANEIRENMNRKIGSDVLPMIIEIPDKDGSSGGSSDQINDLIKRVIGAEMVK